jgi:hypothetical protein
MVGSLIVGARAKTYTGKKVGNLAVCDNKTVCREEGPHAACVVGFIARTE